MKRRICIILVALLVLSLLGCQVPDPPPTITPNVDVTPGTTAGTDPTTEPTTEPSTEPVTGPSSKPVEDLSTEPTADPTTEPTMEPTTVPTTEPTTVPTTEPTTAPTTAPTTNPTTEPTTAPTTEPSTEPVHTHEYKSTVFAPTCTKDGYTAYACKCGDTYTDNYVDEKGHDYETKVIAPTTTSQGYTVYTCSECGYSFKDDYTEKLPEPTGHQHNFVVQKVQEPTCLDMGFTFLLCDCGEEVFEDIKDALGHDFSSGATCSRCGYSKESTVKLDYAAAIAYGNQYAANTYGWTIDLSLNEGNAGFNFPSSESVDNVISKGGQAYLNKRVTQKVDALYSTLSSRGDTYGYRINCDVYEYGDGGILIYVYYS